MKTVNLVTIATQKIPSGMINYVSKNEPSRMQIEKLLKETIGEFNIATNLEYIDFEQLHGKAKLYTYYLDNETCNVLVERRDLIEFPK